eukprot:c12324_g1_i1.p1 GENE.c12324_g1_i1~~c12324_g1_i1.p1  ORF type:complete len:646 (-),score=169.97 c12324_g1_i1:404-2341(-)
MDASSKDVSRLRREALDEKKKKLEQLRLVKAEKETEAAAKRQEVGKGGESAPNGASGESISPTKKSYSVEAPGPDNIDDLVKTLLVNNEPKSSDSNNALSADEIADRERRQRAAKMAALASQHNVVNINIPSRDVPTYDKGIQATDSAGGHTSQQHISSGPDGLPPRTPRRVAIVVDEPKTEQPAPAPEQAPAAAKFEIPQMSEQQRREVIESSSFLDFVAHATHLAAKALEVAERGLNIRKNYAEDESKDVGGDKVVQERCQFYDEALCKNRAVMDISFSPKHPELVVVAYSDRMQGNTLDEGSGGMVIVWNTLAPSTYEMVFYCQSSVLRAIFSPFNPNLIIGSTYSGQIVVWDKTQIPRDRILNMPTHRTPLSPHGHTFPVYCLDLVGSDNAHSLVTVSTDGKLRAWNVNQLSEPQGTAVDLKFPAKKEDPLAVSCSSFVDGDSNTCVVGSENGELFTVARMTYSDPVVATHSRHDGPVTGVSCHPVSGKTDFSGLMLSCSMDWTIRLWDRRQNVLLHVMEDSSDYVYDVKWSPTHPAVFASVDGTGVLSVWNLNSETDLPITKVQALSDHALNRVQWSKDGKLVAVGSSNGQCFVYEATREIATPESGAWRQLSQVVRQLQDKKDDIITAAAPADDTQTAA